MNGDGPSVHEREVWIVDFVSDGPDHGLTIREIWEAAQADPVEPGRGPDAVRGGLSETVSLPSYHRTIAKLVRRGQLEEVEPDEDGAARYVATDQLSPLNTFTLNDLDNALWELSAPEAFAMYVDAVDYYESRADSVLSRAAEALMREDPRELVMGFLVDAVEHLADDIEDLHSAAEADPRLVRRVETALRSLGHFVYGELGLSGATWTIPSMVDVLGGADVAPGSWDVVREGVNRRVWGESFIELVEVRDPPIDSEMIVAGTDGSSHAGFVRGIPAPAFAEEEGRLMLTFNNSIAYVELPDDHPRKPRFPYHGVPMTRSALEDPHNRGMIISRPWFDSLTDSEFEHMKKASLDVVQFRVDERLMTGTARAYGTNPVAGESGLLPKPNLLVRDGTVTPQERELQHYTAPNAYGDVVREGIALSYSILKSVKDSRSRVFAGAVKSTQLKTFSRLVNWYIARGSGLGGREVIDSSWDMARAAHVTDAVAVTRLLHSLPELKGTQRYYRTCVITRPFSAMVTSLRGLSLSTTEEWLGWFRDRKRRRTEEWRKSGGVRPYFADVDVDDDPYVRMVQEADYGMFYFGRPGGDPQIRLPRFEFMDSLRELAVDQWRARVARAVEMIITGVHTTKWTLDREHNYLSGFRLPRLVPYVVYEAHEKCKVLGHKLESELRQAIAANLAQLKALRGSPGPKAELEPVSLTDYLSRAAKLLLPAKGDESDDDEPGEPRSA